MFKDMSKMAGGPLLAGGTAPSGGGATSTCAGGPPGLGGPPGHSVLGGALVPGGPVVDSPFYRTGSAAALGMPGAYPGAYGAPGLLHPGLGGPTPFVPPSHLPSFAPKVIFRGRTDDVAGRLC